LVPPRFACHTNQSAQHNTRQKKNDTKKSKRRRRWRRRRTKTAKKQKNEIKKKKKKKNDSQKREQEQDKEAEEEETKEEEEAGKEEEGGSPFLKPYRRHIWEGFLASGGSWCTSTTPFTVLLSAASLPDRAKFASGSGFSSFPCLPSGSAYEYNSNECIRQ